MFLIPPRKAACTCNVDNICLLCILWWYSCAIICISLYSCLDKKTSAEASPAHNIQGWVMEFPRGGGGCSAKKYIPLLGWQRKTPTLSGTNFAKPYPYWHKIWTEIHTLTGTKNPNLSGTLLENPTLCGNGIGQNGTLAVLAYAYCRQWEYPPGGIPWYLPTSVGRCLQIVTPKCFV